MGQQKSFEDAAFEIFKSLCPDRNINRDEIPYQAVKEMVERHLNSMDPEKRQRLLARIKEEAAQGPSDIDGKTESQAPSSSRPMTISESRSLLLASRHHLLPKLEDFSEAQKIHLKYPKNVRKLVRMRTERRLAGESNDYVNIVCDEQKLPEVFGPIYDQILRKRKTSLQCYHAIINTLHHYFMRTTWSDLVSDVMDEFLANHVVLTCNDLTTKYDREDREADVVERLRDYEVMVLLELHLIKKDPEKIEETEVVNKLGFLVFVADPVHMKDFLDGTVCDQFAHIMPKALAYIYEELCIKMPLDFEDPSAVTSPTRPPDIPELERRSSRKSGMSSTALVERERKRRKERNSGKRKGVVSSPEPDVDKAKMIGLRERVKKAERISKRIAAREKSKTKIGAGLRL